MSHRLSRTILRVVLGLGALAPATLSGLSAHASVAIAAQFDELVQRSRAVAVVVPVEQRSVWEGQRIVTYTRARVDDAIAGPLAKSSEIWISTRGGTVGNIGQSVEGEPVLQVGAPAVAFLREGVTDDEAKSATGVFAVAGRAQGYFPVTEDAASPLHVKKLAISASMGAILPPKGQVPLAQKPLAREVLEGKTFAEARTAIAGAWQRLHAVER